MTTHYDLIIVGAGASGLMAAIEASKLDLKIGVIEHLKSPGRKLLATGGGRCNITNTLPLDKFIGSFGSQSNFIRPALKRFDQTNLIQFLNDNSIETIVPDKIHVYPASQKASDVVTMLKGVVEKAAITVLCGEHVESIENSENLFTIKTNLSQLSAKAVIVATGGKSYEDLGADGSGYGFAEKFGHSMVAPVPAIVDVRIRENWVKECAGLSLQNATVWIDTQEYRKHKRVGDLLFTHKGISGPSVLDLSGTIARELLTNKNVPLRIRTNVDIPREKWAEHFKKWQQYRGSTFFRVQLSEFFPSRLAQYICILSEIYPDVRAADVTRESKSKLLQLILEGIPLIAIGTGDFSAAMVTSGGVTRSEIESRTLMSRKCKGLFFCGEIIDIDGPCGGFNLQWAFSSGVTAGSSAAAFLNSSS